MSEPSPAQQTRLQEWSVDRCVDIHCHILPEIDDGPRTLREALELGRWFVEDGVTTVFATSHQLGRYDGLNTAIVLRQAIAELQAELNAAKIPLELQPGADVRVDERLPDLVDAGEALTAGPAGRHLLLELPHSMYLDPLGTIEALNERGIQTIMTHPERHRYLAGSSKRVASWIEAGAALQVTSGSLLGDFGPSAHQEGWRLIQAGMVSLIASDAHDSSRPPLMTDALNILSQHMGRDFARTVCLENPSRVFQGERVEACRPA
jgi:protein-tyrosine phosphatase